MKYFAILATVFFALVALSPVDAIARPPGGGGNRGWNMGSMSHQPQYYHHHYRSYPNYWYGTPYRYSYSEPAATYITEPVVENPVYSGLPIRITNPADNGVTLSYTLNGVVYSIPPGSSQDLRQDRSWVIKFSRGANFGEASYGLDPGLYTFTRTDRGWELFHGVIAQPSAAPMPSSALPANPSP